MELISELVQAPFLTVVPVGVVIVLIVGLFTYAIRPAQQPRFKLGNLDDRKSGAKKKKLKEKKPALNGHVSTGLPKAEKSPTKEAKKSPEPGKKDKKVEPLVKDVKKTDASKKVVEATDKKKSNKKTSVEKPADFDDGNWETVPSKADKKKKVEGASIKKEKKAKIPLEVPLSNEKVEEKPTVVEEVAEEPAVEKVATVAEPIPVVEEKKEKPKKTKSAKMLKSEPVAEPPQKQVEGANPPPNVVAEPLKSEPAPPIGAIFDELGDTWTEAKPMKKSKKKARRD
ncbi:uncharacterized protein [Euwallacea fornicatus]|uniref:uncharacterized protein n=1 Tax=Euwallacea fornicatus TaxID=995702 RepID=UPI00338F1D28